MGGFGDENGGAQLERGLAEVPVGLQSFAQHVESFHEGVEADVDLWGVNFHPREEFRVDGDGKLVELLGKTFKIHPLILEDVSDVNQRPKFEEYETGNFMIIKALDFDDFTPEKKIAEIKNKSNSAFPVISTLLFRYNCLKNNTP